MAAPRGSKSTGVTYTLQLAKECRSVVKYENKDGVNFYAPKPVGGQDTPPAEILLTVTAKS